jgi:beta-glucanase (GH16 family)
MTIELGGFNLAEWETTWSNGARDQTSTGGIEFDLDSQVSASNGLCVITARLATPADNVPPGLTWGSGIVTSKTQFLPTPTNPVRVSVTAAAPPCATVGQVAPGMWPGICMFADGAWPPEYDLGEIGPNSSAIVVTNHYVNATTKANAQQSITVPLDPTQMVDYDLFWSTTSLVYSINKTPVMVITDPQQISTLPMRLVIMLTVGGVGSWRGPTTSATPASNPFTIQKATVTQ